MCRALPDVPGGVLHRGVPSAVYGVLEGLGRLPLAGLGTDHVLGVRRGAGAAVDLPHGRAVVRVHRKRCAVLGLRRPLPGRDHEVHGGGEASGGRVRLQLAGRGIHAHPALVAGGPGHVPGDPRADRGGGQDPGGAQEDEPEEEVHEGAQVVPEAGGAELHRPGGQRHVGRADEPAGPHAVRHGEPDHVGDECGLGSRQVGDVRRDLLRGHQGERVHVPDSLGEGPRGR
mmetsp:Transcript_55469/g.174032  ORF Transcript_55469/g.174032 Transcript_55469/m.174032 type:complete len:229 (-) Transcript_55469:1140-1826(-)